MKEFSWIEISEKYPVAFLCLKDWIRKVEYHHTLDPEVRFDIVGPREMDHLYMWYEDDSETEFSKEKLLYFFDDVGKGIHITSGWSVAGWTYVIYDENTHEMHMEREITDRYRMLDSAFMRAFELAEPAIKKLNAHIFN